MKKVKDKPDLVQLPPPDPAAAADPASALERRDLDIIKNIMSMTMSLEIISLMK